jgi:hypothetical protein
LRFASARAGSANFAAMPDTQSSNVRVNRNSIQLEGSQLSRMTQLLSGILGWPVIDRTGLTGSYNASLTWGDAPVTNGDVIASTAPAPTTDPHHESIFTAIQDQLDLSLDSQRAPIDTLVIHSMEMPSANEQLSPNRNWHCFFGVRQTTFGSASPEGPSQISRNYPVDVPIRSGFGRTSTFLLNYSCSPLRKHSR